ncbi:MAG: adenylate cyclase [Treponema sp. RIFOXYC1_FULL_61_9]|nr:MAG: adenylate cyclase [Treponema sp. GWA1_62_8]OHE68234.1 MAG: adenylate cyclase [Treponema sp. RIFOXYC1_FULL_61_9]
MAFKKSVYASASEDRLEKLIQERLAAGSDRSTIDKRIWDLFGEEWCVMFTDLSGFSRGVAKFGIIHFLQMIHESERLLIPRIEAHDGIMLKVEGDSFLVIFRNVHKALQCSIDMQRTLAEYNEGKAEEDKVLLCVGLGYGRMLRIGDAEVFGAEVNAASKLGEDTAKAHEILVTGAVREQSADFPDIAFEAIDVEIPGASSAFKVVYRL